MSMALARVAEWLEPAIEADSVSLTSARCCTLAATIPKDPARTTVQSSEDLHVIQSSDPSVASQT